MRLRRQRTQPKVEDGEVFVIRGQEPQLPEFSEDKRPLLTVAAGRLLTDAGERDNNPACLTERFADATQLAILARVPVLLGETITPDLLYEDARLYQWSDAEPRQPGEARPDGDARKATSR